ncbi:MAG: hypothetical protein ACK5HU_01065 [Flavobacteriales bacterium]
MKNLVKLFAVATVVSSIFIACDNNDEQTLNSQLIELQAHNKEDIVRPGQQN